MGSGTLRFYYTWDSSSGQTGNKTMTYQAGPLMKTSKVCCAIFFAALVGSLCAAPQEGAVVSYSLQAKEITLGEPVMLWIRATNHLATTIKLDFGGDFIDNMSISIHDPDGKRTDVPPIRREGAFGTGDIDLAPGMEWTTPMCLSQQINLAKIGGYIIEI